MEGPIPRLVERTVRQHLETPGDMPSAPMGHSGDAAAVAAATGAFVNTEPTFLQSTGFVLDGDGRVAVSVYSRGAIGRLVPQDVAALVRRLRERAQAHT